LTEHRHPAIQDLPIRNESDLPEVRHQVSNAARRLGFGLVEQTKLLTAASELARNILHHAGTGRVVIETMDVNQRHGVRLSFEDEGPGIADVDRAMQDGYTSGKGLGMGLPGAKRLVHEFAITTTPGSGTRIVIAMWKR